MDYSGSSASSRSSSEEDDVEPVVLAKDERRKSTFVRMKEASRDLPGKPKQKNKKHNFFTYLQYKYIYFSLFQLSCTHVYEMLFCFSLFSISHKNQKLTILNNLFTIVFYNNTILFISKTVNVVMDKENQLERNGDL